ncbi:uncharacterized protein SCODWIG_02409 [Saccharomycodes ludwigii]|uniref:HORMA domain-containing protein n=1 Tax=Saccharomycodes ludwigii TaxID=36035 RepID=A0A376B7K6_9ASCO|nr:uncharacterized protein SCODWIG_02409 [Saccharomycodes ludwigii]
MRDYLVIYLKCWINIILYYRNVYPLTSFTLTTFNVFNLPQQIPINRNPKLINYIETLIADVVDDKLINLSLSSITVAIIEIENNNETIKGKTHITNDNVIVEKYILDFQEFQYDNIKLSSSPNDDDACGKEMIFQEFRSSLNNFTNFIKNLPYGFKDGQVKFKVFIECLDQMLGLDPGRDVKFNWALRRKHELFHVNNNIEENFIFQDNENNIPVQNCKKSLGCCVIGENKVIYHLFESLK